MYIKVPRHISHIHMETKFKFLKNTNTGVLYNHCSFLAQFQSEVIKKLTIEHTGLQIEM